MCVGNAFLDCRAAFHLIFVSLLVTNPTLKQTVEWRNYAHADAVIVQRNVPEPALLIFSLKHNGSPFILARIAVSTLPVGPNGPFVQHWVPHSQLLFLLNQATLTTGVDNHLGSHLFNGTVGMSGNYPNSLISFEQYFANMYAFFRFHPVFARVGQHHHVELAAHHLPGLGTFVRFVIREIKRCGKFAIRANKLNAMFFHKVALAQLVQHAQLLQNPIRFGNQRFTNVEAWKPFPFKQSNIKSTLGYESGNSGSGGSAANNDYVWIIAHL